MVHPPYRLLTDERLAVLTARGDGTAFGALYRRHESVLLRYCRSITGDADDARDALQNAMLRALAAFDRGGPEGPVKPWLFRIAHNESVNVLRRRRGEVRMAEPEPATTAAGADERLAEREALREVVAEIVRLPERQRGALVLRELEGLEYADVATKLEVSEVNARQLVFAARHGLAESAAGRELSCADVQGELAAGDLRARRRRRLRAHLRECDACRAYATDGRGRRAVALLPKWLVGWTGLQGLFGPAAGTVAGSGAGEIAAKSAATLAVVAAAATAGPTALDQARHHAPTRHHAAVAVAHASAAAAPTPTRAAPATTTTAAAARTAAKPAATTVTTPARTTTASSTTKPKPAPKRHEPVANDDDPPPAERTLYADARDDAGGDPPARDDPQPAPPRRDRWSDAPANAGGQDGQWGRGGQDQAMRASRDQRDDCPPAAADPPPAAPSPEAQPQPAPQSS